MEDPPSDSDGSDGGEGKGSDGDGGDGFDPDNANAAAGDDDADAHGDGIIVKSLTMKGCDKKNSRSAEADVQLVQRGPEFFLRFTGLELANPKKAHLFLFASSTKKGAKGVTKVDGNGWTRLFIDISKDDNGLISGSQNMVDAHLAAQIADTSTVTDAKTTTFEQNLQEAGYFDDPEKLKGLLIAKPADSRPATASAVVYGFGTMAKYKQNFSGVLGKVKDKTAQMLKAAEAMAKQAAAKKGTLSLSEIKAKGKAAFASMDLSTNDDTVDYEKYVEETCNIRVEERCIQYTSKKSIRAL